MRGARAKCNARATMEMGSVSSSHFEAGIDVDSLIPGPERLDHCFWADRNINKRLPHVNRDLLVSRGLALLPTEGSLHRRLTACSAPNCLSRRPGNGGGRRLRDLASLSRHSVLKPLHNSGAYRAFTQLSIQCPTIPLGGETCKLACLRRGTACRRSIVRWLRWPWPSCRRRGLAAPASRERRPGWGSSR